ncbi:MAG TPA: hypothetical protein VF516_16015 [Kofleriaceae bacterium]
MTVPRIAMVMVLGAWAGCIDSSFGGVKQANVPASQLAIEPTLVDSDAAPPDGKIPVIVQFFQGNEYVMLSSATLTIDGVAVPYGSMGYTTRIPIVPSGDSITFTHVRAGVTTQFTYRVPSRPTITSPMANEVVPRSPNLMIGYASSNGLAVRPLAADAVAGTSGIEQSDNGMAFLDVSGLRSGAGSVGVARRYVTTPSQTGFRSATVTYTITSLPTPVTWQ